MSEWRTIRLGQVAQEVTVGHVGPMVDEYRQSGVPFLRSQNVRPYRVDLDDVKFIDEAFHAQLKKSALRPGDVVTVRTGKPGQTAVVPDTLTVANCADLVITRPGPELNSRWLSYYMNWVIDSHISGHLVGAVQQHFNVKSAKGLELVLPPRREQEAIAGVLGALDDKIAANAALATTAVELADSQFALRASGIQPSQSFAALANVKGGGTPSTKVDDYWGGAVKWATPTDVTNLSIPYLESTGRQITDEGLAACASELHPVGSILMTSRATIGAFAIAQTPTAVNQGFIVVNAHDPGAQWWLFHEMRSRVPEFLSHANGATFMELSRGKFKALPVRFPDVPTYKGFAETVRPLHERARAAGQESSVLGTIRDTLLPQLMSGKIRVRDAERVVEGVV